MNIRSAISANLWKSRITFGSLFILIIGMSFIFSGISHFVWVGTAIILIGMYLSYRYADEFILTISNTNAIKKQDYPNLYRITENLAIGSGLKMPKLYVINSKALNAFATGSDPNHASICVTSGLVEQLTNTELEGVVAHEISHIKNNDIRYMASIAVLIGFIPLIAELFLRIGSLSDSDDQITSGLQVIFFTIGLICVLLAPFIAPLLQFSISRKREYLADASAVLLTRYPTGLADALEKIARDPQSVKSANRAIAHLYFVNPLKRSRVSWYDKLYSTHPPIEERIRILRLM